MRKTKLITQSKRVIYIYKYTKTLNVNSDYLKRYKNELKERAQVRLLKRKFFKKVSKCAPAQNI